MLTQHLAFSYPDSPLKTPFPQGNFPIKSWI